MFWAEVLAPSAILDSNFRFLLRPLSIEMNLTRPKRFLIVPRYLFLCLATFVNVTAALPDISLQASATASAKSVTGVVVV